MSLYADLGVEPDATPDQIKAAHRRAARKHHPDAGGDRADFDRIQKAFVVLRDPEKRARYDRDGSAEDGPSAPDPALAILASAFNAALGKIENLAKGDLVKVLQRLLQEELQTVEVALLMTEAEIARNKDAIARLGHRGGAKPDVLTGMLNQRATAMERQREQLQERDAAIRSAIDMAADYTWRCDPASEQQRRDVWLDIGEARAEWPGDLPPRSRRGPRAGDWL